MAKRFITPFAEAGDRAAMPDVPVGTDSNYQTGYPSQYEEDPVVNPTTAKFVERDKSNQLFNDITSNIKEWQEHVYPAFISAAVNGGVPFQYKKDSIVTFSGVDYISLVDSNVDIPTTDKWKVYEPISKSGRYNSHFELLQEAIDSKDGSRIFNGSVIRIGSRSDGLFDIALAATFTPNGARTVQLDGFPLLVARLRVNNKLISSQLCEFSDGIGDDTTGLNECLSLVASGVKLGIDAKHLHTATLACVTSGVVDIESIGDGKIITDTSITDNTGLWVSHFPFVGDSTVYAVAATRPGAAGVALSIDADRLDRTITVADGSSFSQGDYIYIISTDDWLVGANIKRGENRKINKVVGNVITLDGGIDDNYTAATTTCFPYNPPIVNIKNLKMTGPNDGQNIIGVDLYECASINIIHPTVEKYNFRLIQTNFVVGGVISNVNNDFADQSGSNQYSLVLNATRDVDVKGGSLRGGRHSFATGGLIPCRNILLDGVSLYSSDPFSNNVATLDTHEGMVNFRAINNTVYGGVDISGENLDFSKNTVYLSDELNLRAVSIRAFTSSDYITADDNEVLGIDCAGGILIRHLLPNVTIGRVSQQNNMVDILTASNKAGVGLEPNPVAGCVINHLIQSGNTVNMSGTASNAPAISNYDIDDFSQLVDIKHLVCKDNKGVTSVGSALEYFSAVRNNGTIADNKFESTSAAARAINVRGFKELDYDNNHAVMSLAALAAESSNLFRDIDTLNINNGSMTNSFHNGYRLLSVTESNPVNLKRINCVIDPTDVSRLNAPYVVHSSITADGLGVAGESYQCTVSKSNTGLYLVVFDSTRPFPTNYPCHATVSAAGTAHCIYNNVNSCFVVTTDYSGTLVDLPFTFTSW